MRRKSLLMIFVLFISFALNLTGLTVKSFDGEAYAAANTVSDKTESSHNAVAQADNNTVTMRDIAAFLMDKNEHYPLSDEFIERYQQTSGGYLSTAKAKGILIDKQQHSPNQKWHFFESWLYPSADEAAEKGKDFWEESALTRVYNGLQCPELLLWIYEASGVDPVKVNAAKKAAEQGKVNKTNTQTMAKNMRACVPWEDIESAILGYEFATQKVSVKIGDGFTVTGIQNEHKVGSQVSFTVNVTDESKEIAEVRANNDVLTATDGSTYKFTMPDETVVISVNLKNKPARVVLNYQTLTLTVGEESTITSAIEFGEATDSAVWSVAEGNEFVNITPSGSEVNVSAVAKGTAKIKVSYGESLFAECIVTVKEPRDPSVKFVTKYNFSGSSTAEIKTVENALVAFIPVGEGEGIIESVVEITSVYGGGYGGNTTAGTYWKSTDVVKIGTGSKCGSITFNLNCEVSRVVITGYVGNAKCEIRVGDSKSADWSDETGDGKTATSVCSDMTVIGKDALESGPSTIILDFESSSTVTIATVNATNTKYPLYIASIEFVLGDDAN